VLVYDMLGDSRIYVRSVGTRRPWRGRGLATSLLAQVLCNAAAQGAKSARLDVDAENPTGALGVYERLGFAAIRSEVAYSIPC
jgi:mycothiol synthase